MSTPITLAVGGITLTYNTGHMGLDHGMLFQERDRMPLECPATDSSDSLDYDEPLSEMCFRRTLGSMVQRLELLGYTLKMVEAEYEAQVALDYEQQLEVDPIQVPRLTFAQFVDFIRAHPVRDLKDDYSDFYDSQFAVGAVLLSMDPAVKLLPEGDPFRDKSRYSERSHFGTLIGFLDPYSTLRALAENPANLDLEVVWDYGPFVYAGWAKSEDFVAGARRTQTYLLATEGTSDTHILQRSLALLRPDIEDFFRFIDVEERHPFSGTGSLAKFAEGLVKIDVHNRVIFIFDNDAEGSETYRSLQRFTFPVNMRAMLLPDLEEFRNFPARGPGGVACADINGCAAAIECYLDLRLKNRPPAQVTWTNFKESLGIYQGSLDFKESYAKAFFQAKPQAMASGSYDTGKLCAVLDCLFTQCTAMATQMNLNKRAYRI